LGPAPTPAPIASDGRSHALELSGGPSLRRALCRFEAHPLIRPAGSASTFGCLLRLLRRLAGDRSLPRGVRVRLWLLLAYLAIPIDVIPVLGYADDAIIVTAVLRSVVRRAGLEALHRHWPGTDDGLAAVIRLCGLARQPYPSDAG